jgi:hypothetical protein
MSAGSSRGFRASAVVVAALLVVAATCGDAGAVTFGADLSLAANTGFDCTVWPVIGSFVASNAQTCTWSSFAVPADLTQGLIVPAGDGTVTQVRVKVGASTGQMQVVVFQALRDGDTNDVGCC